MKLTFNDIIDKHKKQPSIVVAHGSSLNNYLPKLQNLKDKGFIIIECNEWPNFSKTIPNYWVVANSALTMMSWKDRINQYKNDTIMVYADSVDTTDRQWIANNIEINYLPYDQRHFGGNLCNTPNTCCRHIDLFRKTIQEELQQYCKVDYKYSTGDSVCVHQLALSVLLGCDPIYFIGIDLDYSLGYANNVQNFSHNNELLICKPRIVNDMKIIENSIKNLGKELINLNKNSDLPFKIGEII